MILVDIWGRENIKKAPYADMTWMFFFGTTPDPAFQKGFSYIIKARNKALQYIEQQIKNNILPMGKDVDAVSRNYLAKQKLAHYFQHTLGHALGTVSPHAVYSGLSAKSKTPIRRQLGYTIEPGIYFPKKYGFRTEINFYISKKNKIVITTPLQKNITCL